MLWVAFGYVMRPAVYTLRCCSGSVLQVGMVYPLHVSKIVLHCSSNAPTYVTSPLTLICNCVRVMQLKQAEQWAVEGMPTEQWAVEGMPLPSWVLIDLHSPQTFALLIPVYIWRMWLVEGHVTMNYIYKANRSHSLQGWCTASEWQQYSNSIPNYSQLP